MKNKQQLADLIFNKDAPVQVYPAEVLSVSGRSCTVRLLASGLEVEGVRLVADVDSQKHLLLTPSVGSTVLVGCIENDVANLYVAQFSEVDKAEMVIGDSRVWIQDGRLLALSKYCTLNISDNALLIEQSDMKIQLQGGQVSITNGAVSLKDLFSDLTTLLNTFIVLTPAGPSTALGPNSIAALTQLTAKVNQLLS